MSAGFDAAQGDPLGGYHVTPEGYAHLTHMLMSLAEGRVLLILEVSSDVKQHGVRFNENLIWYHILKRTEAAHKDRTQKSPVIKSIQF